MRRIYSNSSMDPFPESELGFCSSPAPGSSPSACGAGFVAISVKLTYSPE